MQTGKVQSPQSGHSWCFTLKLYWEGTQLGIICFLLPPETDFVFSTVLSMNRNESRPKIHTRTFLCRYQWKHSFPFCLSFQGNTIEQLTFDISVNIWSKRQNVNCVLSIWIISGLSCRLRWMFQTDKQMYFNHKHSWFCFTIIPFIFYHMILNDDFLFNLQCKQKIQSNLPRSQVTTHSIRACSMCLGSKTF